MEGSAKPANIIRLPKLRMSSPNSPSPMASAPEDPVNKRYLGTFNYKPGKLLPLFPAEYVNCVFNIRVQSKYLSAFNSKVLDRQIWGSDGVYTDDSDAVAALMHSGRATLGFHPLPTGFNITCQVLPRQSLYKSSYSNGIESREWGNDHTGLSFKIIESQPIKPKWEPTLSVKSDTPSVSLVFGRDLSVAERFTAKHVADTSLDRQGLFSYKLGTRPLKLDTDKGLLEISKQSGLGDAYSVLLNGRDFVPKLGWQDLKWSDEGVKFNDHAFKIKMIVAK